MTRRKRLPWKRLLGAALLGLALLLFAATRTTTPVLPPGIVKETHRLDCGGDRVTVDFYFQPDAPPQPLVIVAHGFSRGRRHMAGWGIELARRGLIAAVPAQPHWTAQVRNGRALVRLLELGREGRWPARVKGNGKTALVGFSMGGLTTLLAAARLETPVDAWVGLDPVDMKGLGAAKAAQARAPGLVLLAEPATFNLHGNAPGMLLTYGGPLQVLRVKDATHCDPESPTDWLGQAACGPVDPGRHRVFLETAARFLEAVLLGKGTARIEETEALREVMRLEGPG